MINHIQKTNALFSFKDRLGHSKFTDILYDLSTLKLTWICRTTLDFPLCKSNVRWVCGILLAWRGRDKQGRGSTCVDVRPGGIFATKKPIGIWGQLQSNGYGYYEILGWDGYGVSKSISGEECFLKQIVICTL